MWFKQLQLFHIGGKPPKKTDTFTEKLNNFCFQPCLSATASSHGWDAPIQLDEAPLLHAANGYFMLCLKIEEKILPATVVRQTLEERVRQLEQNDQRLSRQAKANLKDEITFDLMPRAFSKYTRIFASIDPHHDLLILNTSSKRHTELFLDAMQKTFPLMKLQRLETKKIGRVMTNWVLKDKLPKGFFLEKSCTLQDSQYQARTIQCKEQELQATPIMNLIADGCEVRQLALNWQERMQFKLADDFIFRNVKFAEELIDSAKSMADDPQSQFDADFAIMTETLTEFFNAVFPLVLKKEEVAVA